MPPRQTGSSPPTRRMSRSRQRDVNVDGPLPRNQARGAGQGVHHDERVHPAAVGGGDEQVAAAGGRSSWPDVLIRNRNSAEEHEAGDEPQDAVQEGRPGLGLAAEPRQPLRGAPAARRREGLRGEAEGGGRRRAAGPAPRARPSGGSATASGPAPEPGPARRLRRHVPRPRRRRHVSPSASPGIGVLDPGVVVRRLASSIAVVVLGRFRLVVLDPLLVVEVLLLGRRRLAPALGVRAPAGAGTRAATATTTITATDTSCAVGIP